MSKQQYLKIETLCIHYEVDTVFIDQLHEAGVITIHLHEESKCIKGKQLKRLEKIIRLHRELNLNPEGIDVVLNLLKRIKKQQREINNLKNLLDINI
jgi:pyridoxine 5'-phosphate synthase PdxJ